MQEVILDLYKTMMSKYDSCNDESLPKICNDESLPKIINFFRLITP